MIILDWDWVCAGWMDGWWAGMEWWWSILVTSFATTSHDYVHLPRRPKTESHVASRWELLFCLCDKVQNIHSEMFDGRGGGGSIQVQVVGRMGFYARTKRREWGTTSFSAAAFKCLRNDDVCTTDRPTGLMMSSGWWRMDGGG